MLLRTLLGMIVGLFVVGLSFIFIRLPPPATDAEPPPAMSGESTAAAYISLLAMTAFCASYGLGLGNVVRRLHSHRFSSLRR